MSQGKPARILRGYIRRAEYDVKDEMSKARLYFMYNPEYITREYVSYLEQSALDPFNTVYQSGNLIAPPSIMNFSFELFFDRQEEALPTPITPACSWTTSSSTWWSATSCPPTPTSRTTRCPTTA